MIVISGKAEVNMETGCFIIRLLIIILNLMDILNMILLQQHFMHIQQVFLLQAAKELGKTEDEKFYTDLFNKIKEVFINEYVTNAGRVGTNSQTSYVLALDV